jgi:ATP-dependent 26S proteasome regulatory subunit
VPFFDVTVGTLFSMYAAEFEKIVAALFALAQEISPSMIFIGRVIPLHAAHPSAIGTF